MVAYVDAHAAEVLYGELQAKAPRWLEDAGFKTSVEFSWWARQEPIFAVRIPEGLVLVQHWYRGVRAELHPLIFDWRAARGVIAERLHDVAEQLGVRRLEFRLKWPSRTLKRYMASAGCAYEGTARSYDWSYLDGMQRLIDVEVWSMLHEVKE